MELWIQGMGITAFEKLHRACMEIFYHHFQSSARLLI